MRENQELFAELELFKGVKANTLGQLWQHGKVRTYMKDKVLFHSGEKVKCIYIVLTGKAIIYNLTHAGKRKILFVMGEGGLLNEHVMGYQAASVSCETIEPCSIFVIPVADFMACMEQDFTFVTSVVWAQERKIWRLGHQLKNTMGSIQMERKLAAKLWKLSRDFGITTPEGIEIDIDLTITFLADMMGAPRETTSRLCKSLSDAGLIRINRPRITIVDSGRMSLFYKTGKLE